MIVLLDIDGTLVHSDNHHAIAGYRAFRAHGITLPIWQIHRHIGMGGDQFVPAHRGHRIVFASSAQADEAKRYIDRLESRDLARLGGRPGEDADPGGADRRLLG